MKPCLFAVIAAAILFVPAIALGLPPDRIGADENAMGRANAPVTMIEYFSPGCTACAYFGTDIFPLLKAKYIDTGKVRFVMRLYPLFPIDGDAYKLARCVPKNRFFAAIDLLFHRQAEWDKGEFRVADPHGALVRLGQSLGLTVKQADDCMTSKKLDAAINAASQEAEARYAPSDTPTFVINYVKYVNGAGWDDIQTTLNAALAKHR